jgi:hypothetical protein
LILEEEGYMAKEEFFHQFFLLVLSGIATISILLVLLFLGMLILDLLTRGWVKKIKNESENESAREWAERES